MNIFIGVLIKLLTYVGAYIIIQRNGQKTETGGETAICPKKYKQTRWLEKGNP